MKIAPNTCTQSNYSIILISIMCESHKTHRFERCAYPNYNKLWLLLKYNLLYSKMHYRLQMQTLIHTSMRCPKYKDPINVMCIFFL